MNRGIGSYDADDDPVVEEKFGLDRVRLRAMLTNTITRKIMDDFR